MPKNKFETDTVDFEITFFEKLLAQDENEITVLIPLGNAYTQKGLYEKGLAVDKKLVNLQPDNPVFHYNLACSLSLLERIDEAIKALGNALKLGYRDFGHMNKDTDLDNIRLDKRFKSLLNKYQSLGK